MGEDAALGAVEAADVARLILGVERAVARAAAVSINKPLKERGRWTKRIEEASSFRLRDVTEGSVVLDLELPGLTAEDNQLELQVASLGDQGWDTAMAALEEDPTADPRVVRALADLADQLNIGTRYEAIELNRYGDKRTVRLDGDRRAKLREAVRRQRLQLDSGISGTLVEADFEKNTAHVRTPDGALVEVVFDGGQADDVQEALRQQSAFEGEVIFDPVTNSVRSVRLRQLIRSEQLTLGEDEAGAFWRSPSLSDLQVEAGVRPVLTFEGLYDDTLSDEEFEEFLTVADL